MKKSRNLLLLIISGISMVSCYPARMTVFKEHPKVKNVIYMIGDGMGLAHIYAAITVSGKPLNIERCEVTGLQKTYSADSYITDSADALIQEILDFDKAIGVALDFAQNNRKTLVVITADHETGGVTITGGDIKTNNAGLNFSTIGHTALMVPVYAYGPGSEKFKGIYDNTEIFQKILASYKFTQLRQQKP